MRITPTLCIQCGSWFRPKTKRKQRNCSNSCRQASYLGKQENGIQFDCPTDEETQELIKILQDADTSVDASPEHCLEALYEKNHELYRDIIWRWGVDRFGVNGRKFIYQNPTNN